MAATKKKAQRAPEETADTAQLKPVTFSGDPLVDLLPLREGGVLSVRKAGLVKAATVKRVMKRAGIARVSKPSCELVRDYLVVRLDSLIAKALIIMKKMDRITLTEEHIRAALLLETSIPANSIIAMDVLMDIFSDFRKARSAEAAEKSLDLKEPRDTPKKTLKTPGRSDPKVADRSMKSNLNQTIIRSPELRKLGASGYVPMRSMRTLWKEKSEDLVFFSEPRISKRALFALRCFFEVMVADTAQRASAYLEGRATLSRKSVLMYLMRDKTFPVV